MHNLPCAARDDQRNLLKVQERCNVRVNPVQPTHLDLPWIGVSGVDAPQAQELGWEPRPAPQPSLLSHLASKPRAGLIPPPRGQVGELGHPPGPKGPREEWEKKTGNNSIQKLRQPIII